MAKSNGFFLQKEILVPSNFKYLNMLLSFETSNADFTVRSAWFDDLKIEKVIPNSQNEIIAESSYYPFGLEHNSGNNIVTSTSAAYKYKFQEQERQDELGLNWDSFKWRNYDYAIGRFMSLDPLAEKYNYQSPYNFSENRVVDSRELEGLEAVKSTNGDCVDVTIRVKPINSTNVYPISDQQMNTAMSNFASQTEKSYRGQTSNNQEVSVTVIIDPNATLTVNFKDIVENPEIKKGNNKEVNTTEALNASAPEFTSENSQTGNIQVSSKNTFPNSDDTATSQKKGPGHSASHGLGHALGLTHDSVDAKKNGNLMRDGSDNNERTISESQRTEMLKNIPEITGKK